jgi:hypothetical protein
LTDVPPEAQVDQPVEPQPPAERDPRWWLPWAGLVVGVWATLPKYSGPHLETKAANEVADHIIPGILVLVVSVYCLATAGARSRRGPTLVPFVCGTLVLLAGFWMMATHIPLIAQALRDEVGWAPTIYHSSAALATFGLGLLWTAFHWRDLAAVEAAQAPAQAAPGPAADTDAG